MACIRRARTHRRRSATWRSNFGRGLSALAETLMALISVILCTLGAIAPDGDVARRAGRILAAFYIPSMPPALLERHGIELERVAAVTEAFAAGDVQRALEATPEEVADQIMVAGTPEDWVPRLTETYAPAGLNHALVSFTDPFTLRAWAGLDVEGLPDLGEQVRIFGERVLREVYSL